MNQLTKPNDQRKEDRFNYMTRDKERTMSHFEATGTEEMTINRERPLSFYETDYFIQNKREEASC